MIRKEKTTGQLESNHSEIQETPERGSDKRRFCVWMDASSQRLQSTLRELSLEAISGLKLFWQPTWWKWLTIIILIGSEVDLCGIVLDQFTHFATSLFFGRLVDFLPPEPFDLAHGVWISSWSTARLWLLPLIVAAGGLISGLLTHWAKSPDGTETKGLSGADSSIRTWHEDVSVLKRVPVIVMTASPILIGSGGSAGLEGPSVQIGLGIGSAIADWFHLTAAERRLVQAWRMGALVAVAFHSPIGGGIFAGEILQRRGAALKVIPGALLVSIISCGLAGWSPVMIWPGKASTVVWWHLYCMSIALGLLCGCTGRLYASLLSWTKKHFKKMKLLAPLKPMLGGLLAGLLGLAFPQVLGLSDGWLQLSISQPTNWLALPLWIIIALPIAKLLATCLSVGSGGIGGIFGPGMIIGGLLGAAYWSVLHQLPLPAGAIGNTPVLFVMIGIVALLGPIACTPVAVIIMMANFIGNASFVPAAVCALIVSSWIVRGKTLYPSQC